MNNSTEIKCTYCLRDHPLVTMTATQYGDICIFCSVVVWYDSLERREDELSPEEMRKLFPERVFLENRRKK